jgi:Na+/citrate or Na+/malate symporter
MTISSTVEGGEDDDIIIGGGEILVMMILLTLVISRELIDAEIVQSCQYIDKKNNFLDGQVFWHGHA